MKQNPVGLLMGLLMSLLVCLLPLVSVARAADTPLEAAIKAAFQRGDLEGLHGVLIREHGRVIAQVYFDGKDQRWGQPLGIVQHGPEVLHDLRSITKSVVALLYGIALDDGIVPPPSANLMAQFPEYADLAEDPRRAKITIRDALTMRMGSAWNEEPPYTSAKNSEIAMEYAEDRYRFVLEQDMVTTPGRRWSYSGGATALIARVIEKGAGERIDKYAARRLFRPLGITSWEWVAGADGVRSSASGLRLTTAGMAQIGELIRARGRIGDRQVAPAAWVDEMTEPHVRLRTGLGYGYYWFIAPGAQPAWVAGFGNGGQRLSVNRKLGLVFVVTAGRYNDPDAWRLPVRISRDLLGPYLERK